MNTDNKKVQPIQVSLGNVVDCTGDEQEVFLYTFSTINGVTVKFCSYGATLYSIEAPDKHGNCDEILLAFDKIEDHMKYSFFGSTIGRVANRIKNGKFTLNKKEYTLPINNKTNHLHGGPEGWDKYVWGSKMDEESVIMTMNSPDGDQGYPGSVIAQVTYTVSEFGSICMEYLAVPMKETPINMTNHAYFNLAGHASGQKGLHEHIVKLNANKYIPVSEDLIPLGDRRDAVGTPFDLRKKNTFGYFIENSPNKEGFDHCFCINKSKEDCIKWAATFIHPDSGRKLEIQTTQKGIQLYTGNFLPKEEGKLVGKNGVSYVYQGGFCCEAQGYPDAVNQKNFPSVLCTPDEVYKQTIIYRIFLVESLDE